MSHRLETWPKWDGLTTLVRHGEKKAISVGYTRSEAAKEGGSEAASSNVDKRGAKPLCAEKEVRLWTTFKVKW